MKRKIVATTNSYRLASKLSVLEQPLQYENIWDQQKSKTRTMKKDQN